MEVETLRAGAYIDVKTSRMDRLLSGGLEKMVYLESDVDSGAKPLFSISSSLPDPHLFVGTGKRALEQRVVVLVTPMMIPLSFRDLPNVSLVSYLSKMLAAALARADLVSTWITYGNCVGQYGFVSAFSQRGQISWSSLRLD